MPPLEIKPEPEKKDLPPISASGVQAEDPRIKSLRTYQGDVQEAVVKNKFTSTNILAAEQNKKGHSLMDFGGTKENSVAKNKFFILVGSILLLLGIITIVAVYYTRASQKIVVQQQTEALIPFSQEKDLSMAGITRQDLITNIVDDNKSAGLPVNSVLYINTVDGQNNPDDISDLIGFLAPQMPPALIRSLDTKYMVGIYSFDVNEPFIIFTVSDYASSFAGMLKWESAMPQDLDKLFSISADIGTTTPVFTDEALRNKDLRILQDANQKTILLYSFIDKNTLLITANENVFNAIVDQYTNNQVR